MLASLSVLTLLLVAAPAKANPEAAMLLADQRIAAGDFDGAERVVRELAKKDPSTAGIHLKLGEISEARSRPREAFLEYQWEVFRAGGERPTGAEAARRGVALARKPGSEAMEILRVMRQPAGPEESLKRVRELRAAGDHFVLRVLEAEMAEAAGESGSEARFRALVKEDPMFVPARLGLARALESAGKSAHAAKELAAARAIDPDHWSLKE